MIKKEKIAAVTEYLAGAFKGYDIADRYDYELDAQTFIVTKLATRYLLKISEDFFAENGVSGIVEILKDYEVAEFLRESDAAIFDGRDLKTLR